MNVASPHRKLSTPGEKMIRIEPLQSILQSILLHCSENQEGRSYALASSEFLTVAVATSESNRLMNTRAFYRNTRIRRWIGIASCSKNNCAKSQELRRRLMLADLQKPPPILRREQCPPRRGSD